MPDMADRPILSSVSPLRPDAAPVTTTDAGKRDDCHIAAEVTWWRDNRPAGESTAFERRRARELAGGDAA